VPAQSNKLFNVVSSASWTLSIMLWKNELEISGLAQMSFTLSASSGPYIGDNGLDVAPQWVF
jgi:hypothetical protein